jgi:hypothetical protein
MKNSNSALSVNAQENWASDKLIAIFDQHIFCRYSPIFMGDDEKCWAEFSLGLSQAFRAALSACSQGAAACAPAPAICEDGVA